MPVLDPETSRKIVRWAPWVIVIALALFALLPAFFAVAPVGCVSCHRAYGLVHDVTSEAHSGTGATCATCHIGSGALARARFGFYQAYAMTIPVLSTHGSRAAAVPDAACTSCHDTLGPITESGGLRVKHGVCTEGATCSSCHSTAAHPTELRWPTTYNMDVCLRCHQPRQVSANCETCHTGSLSRDKPTSGPWTITHGPNWESTHGMGNMSTCSSCHPAGYCTRCHGAGIPHDEKFFAGHGSFAQAKDATCENCHATTFCSDCHGIEMPHPRAFVQGHSATVEDTGDALCKRCHAENDCVECHVKHVHPGGAIPRGSAGVR